MTDAPAISWSAAQLAALERVRAWLADPFAPGLTREPGVFRLFGHAGSGKSTLARELASSVSGVVRYAAFTGKAALVMYKKGCLGATTIHRLIYLPRQKCQQRLRELAEKLRAETDADRRRELQLEHDEERKNLARPSWTLNTTSPLRDAALLVIDEVSMVGARMGEDLLTFKVPILALGDPAQLPPVQDRGYFTDPRQQPDLLLTEVHRQAEGSPVLRLAGLARQGAALPPGEYVQEGHAASRVVGKKDVPMSVAAREFDQIIVGRNRTRRQVNTRIRAELGYPEEPFPVAGERLVCLRNDGETGLLNGSQWTCLGAERIDADRAVLSIIDEDGAALQVESHLHYFRGEEPPHYEIREAQCFDFAYAITCHKSQGSQWRRVCVVDEGDAFGAEAKRWRYTAITRASDSVTVIR